MKTGSKLGLLALLLAVGTTAFWFYLAREVRLPEDRTGFVILFLGAASLGVIALFKGISIAASVPALGALLLGLFLPYTIWISPQSVDGDRVIQVGDTIPPFTALDGTGERFDSTSLAGERVLIKFFRGHW